MKDQVIEMGVKKDNCPEVFYDDVKELVKVGSVIAWVVPENAIDKYQSVEGATVIEMHETFLIAEEESGRLHFIPFDAMDDDYYNVYLRQA